MAKGKAAEKGNDKSGAAVKGKAKGKTEGEEKGAKVKGAQSINVRHILVHLSAKAYDEHHVG
jgi:peptidyl-prolyl cis-trans isomerase NIMA-interacting 4